MNTARLITSARTSQTVLIVNPEEIVYSLKDTLTSVIATLKELTVQMHSSTELKQRVVNSATFRCTVYPTIDPDGFISWSAHITWIHEPSRTLLHTTRWGSPKAAFEAANKFVQQYMDDIRAISATIETIVSTLA